MTRPWISTPWLIVLLVWAHAGELLFPPEKKWTVVISGLGLVTAVLAWKQRGDRLSGRWLLCAWGACEGLQVFLCQGAYIWWPRAGPNGMCTAYTGWPFLWWGLWGLLIAVYWIAREARNG